MEAFAHGTFEVCKALSGNLVDAKTTHWYDSAAAKIINWACPEIYHIYWSGASMEYLEGKSYQALPPLMKRSNHA